MSLSTFSARYVAPAGSPIRELFPFLGRPGMISFAGGYPSPSLFDAEGLRAAAQQALADPAAALQYGATEGVPALRQALAALCESRGIAADAAQVLVTTGSQQAFDLLVRVFVDPGTNVYVEAPAYPAALQALGLAGARIHEVPVDGDGLDLIQLAQRLKEAPVAERPRLLYTVPSFSNPSGTLLTTARREALIALALEYDFLVIEDDPYGELAFNGRAPTPLYAIGQSLAGDRNPVVYLSSLSKTIAPSLRLGWMIAPPDVLRRCAIAKQTADLCTSPLAQLIGAAYLDSGRYAPNVERALAEYRTRMNAMADALQRETGNALTFVRPAGGMFLWAEYTGSLDMSDVFQRSVDQGVLFVPGKAFYTNTREARSMRLSYAAPSPAEIEIGVRRLSQALRDDSSLPQAPRYRQQGERT